MLYPQKTLTREVFNLDGMWRFATEDGDVNPKRPLANYRWMAVPGSFNAQTPDEKLNNRVGHFWYETSFVVSPEQLKKRNVLRFGSVTHQAEVYLNGQKVLEHIGGFTPFEDDITKYLHEGKNDLKVRVSNILDNSTIPSADYKDGKETYRFDFFNYAGIHRPVKLYTTNQTYLETIRAEYQTDLTKTVVKPAVKIVGSYNHVQLSVLDEDDQVVATTDSLNSELVIAHTHLWQVRNAYLYRLKVDVFDAQDKIIDSYVHHFGVRTIEIKNDKFLINGQPVYFQGFGKHEDFFASGKGLNLPLVNLDYQIMKSLGANSYRTSHYPYAEETMQQADREGFLITDEVPAVGLYVGFNVNVETLKSGDSTWNILHARENHERALREMIARDEDHPAVVMWSIANEPAGGQKGAREYFAPLCKLAKELDWQKRPITWADIGRDDWQDNQIGDLFDVICLNRYYGWYIDRGDLTKAKKDLAQNIEDWHHKYPDKPFIFTEFGADTVPGLHKLSRAPYSEEFQSDLIKVYFEVFDKYPYVIGEQLWNFADFKTSDNLIRVDGNLKGVFTRDRRPKEVVNLLKQRWNHGEESRANK